MKHRKTRDENGEIIGGPGYEDPSAFNHVTGDPLEEFFWENYPHEISWGELKEANPELWCQLQNIGQALVLAGKLKVDYL